MLALTLFHRGEVIDLAISLTHSLTLSLTDSLTLKLASNFSNILWWYSKDDIHHSHWLRLSDEPTFGLLSGYSSVTDWNWRTDTVWLNWLIENVSLKSNENYSLKLTLKLTDWIKLNVWIWLCKIHMLKLSERKWLNEYHWLILIDKIWYTDSRVLAVDLWSCYLFKWCINWATNTFQTKGWQWLHVYP